MPSPAADEIAARIPRRCFRRPDHPHQKRDRTIIAECVATGHTLIASHNLDTIKKNRINRWLIEGQYARTDVIERIEDTLVRLHPGQDIGQTALMIVMGAALPDDAQGATRDLRTIRDFLERLAKSHAATVASEVQDVLNEIGTGTQMERMVRRVRESLPIRSRSSEARRVEATRAAACGAGFDGF